MRVSSRRAFSLTGSLTIAPARAPPPPSSHARAPAAVRERPRVPRAAPDSPRRASGEGKVQALPHAPDAAAILDLAVTVSRGAVGERHRTLEGIQYRRRADLRG